MTNKRATVFCASSKKIDKVFYEATREIARILVENNYTVIYGGGAIGLMGELSKTVLELGGNIEGVIPEFMYKLEWGNPNVKVMTITKDLHERKKLLIKNTDVVIALPGGSGTLEELVEVISLKRLGIFLKPIIIVNTKNFYDPLIELFKNMVTEKFLNPHHLNMWCVINHPSELMDAIKNSCHWNDNAIDIASI